jgi:uncharacterized protein YkwD
MAFERLRAHSALVGAVAVVLVAGVSVASLFVAESRLSQFDRDAGATSSSARPSATTPPSTGPLPSTTAPSTTATTVAASPPAGFVTELFVVMNADRASRGLAPLTWDSRLGATAQLASDAMAASGVVAHQDLTAILALGYTRAAENVLTGPYSVTATSAQYGWMGSTPHRAVILDTNLASVGIGTTSSADGRIWIAVHFGGAI